MPVSTPPMENSQFIHIDIEVGSGLIHCLQDGTGHKLVLAFHGYGLDALSFLPVMQQVNQDCTFLSVDLPHHGKSRWGGTLFTKHLLVQFVTLVMQKYGVEKVSLLGYSLGGRVCLTIAELIPEKMGTIVLVAPDGLVPNLAYNLATKNLLGKLAFKHIVNNPKGFFRLADWLLARKYIDASRHKFVTQYLKTDTSREMLHKVWVGLGPITPNQHRLKEVIRSNKLHIVIFMGSFDRIIPLRNAKKFMEGLETVELHTLNKGHKVIDQITALLIANCFN